MDLELNLGACNPMPLAYYLFPDEHAEIVRMKASNVKFFVKRTPRTLAVAQDLLAQHPVPYNWAEESDEGWVRRQAGVAYVNHRATRNARAKWARLVAEKVVSPSEGGDDYEVLSVHEPLRAQGLAKVLLGIGSAVGICDGWQRGERRYRGTDAVGGERLAGARVRVLRFDLDLPHGEVWPAHSHGDILDQLRLARSLASDLGLELQAYTTGGRGVDLCLPLTAATTIRAASWVTTAFSLLLTDATDGPLRYDTDALQMPVRLPGQRHFRSGRLGLWIDLDEGRFHPPERQRELMARGAADEEGGSPQSRELAFSLASIEARLEEVGIAPTWAVSVDSFVATLDDAPTELVQRFLRTHPEAADSSWRTWQRQRTRSAGRSWDPRETWEREVAKGETWGAMKGPKGLVAASVALFAEGAEDALLERLGRIPAADPRTRTQRASTGRSLLRTHRAAAPIPPPRLRDARDREVTAVDSIVASIEQGTYLQRRVIDSLETVLLAMVVLVERGGGECAVSSDRLAAAIAVCWPDRKADPKTVERRPTDLSGSTLLGRPILQAERSGRKGVVLASSYKLGLDLRRLLDAADSHTI